MINALYIRTRNETGNQTYKEHKEVHLCGEVALGLRVINIKSKKAFSKTGRLFCCPIP